LGLAGAEFRRIGFIAIKARGRSAPAHFLFASLAVHGLLAANIFITRRTAGRKASGQ